MMLFLCKNVFIYGLAKIVLIDSLKLLIVGSIEESVLFARRKNQPPVPRSVTDAGHLIGRNCLIQVRWLVTLLLKQKYVYIY